MKRITLMIFLAICMGQVPAQAQNAGVHDAHTINVGKSLFGCASKDAYSKLVDQVTHNDTQGFARGLLRAVHAGQCVLFKSTEPAVVTSKGNAEGLVQIRREGDTADYWTWLSPSAEADNRPLPLNYGEVRTQLYVGNSAHAPLLVGFGGGEGGNAWASERWKMQRDAFLKKGYAFLAIGYFGMQGTPAGLDRISLNGIHKAILDATKNPQVNGQCIAVIGASKGGELALELASHFDDIKAVVAMVPSDVAYFSLTPPFDTSSWTYNGKPVPFVPFEGRALPAVFKHDLGSVFTMTRNDAESVEDARIRVEKIHGPILLVSASDDQQWPSNEMSRQIMQRLKNAGFPHAYKHITIQGGHASPLKHFDKITAFLDKHFPANSASGCQ